MQDANHLSVHDNAKVWAPIGLATAHYLGDDDWGTECPRCSRICYIKVPERELNGTLEFTCYAVTCGGHWFFRFDLPDCARDAIRR